MGVSEAFAARKRAVRPSSLGRKRNENHYRWSDWNCSGRNFSGPSNPVLGEPTELRTTTGANPRTQRPQMRQILAGRRNKPYTFARTKGKTSHRERSVSSGSSEISARVSVYSWQEAKGLGTPLPRGHDAAKWGNNEG